MKRNIFGSVIHLIALLACLIFLIQANAQARHYRPPQQDDSNSSQLKEDFNRQEQHLENTDKNVSALTSRFDLAEGKVTGGIAILMALHGFGLLKDFFSGKRKEAA